MGAIAAPLIRFYRSRRAAIDVVPADMRHWTLWLPLSITSTIHIWCMRRVHLPMAPPDPAVTISHRIVPGDGARPDVPVFVYEPPERSRPSGALLWIHGGGYVIGSTEQYHHNCCDYATRAGIVVVSVEYRLAPEHPFPAGLEDCYAALRWLHAHAADLGVDPARIAVGGDSAGGGLAAALGQLAHDRGEVPVRFQLLVYPMLDDRTLRASGAPGHGVLVWDARSNAFAWGCYLGHLPGSREPRAYAVPARRDDLAGLPPAWIGTGGLDLFHDENVQYAERLQAAGVACELLDIPGLYHGGDTIPAVTSQTARDFTTSSIEALKAALT